jgi:hypothetical protein
MDTNRDRYTDRDIDRDTDRDTDRGTDTYILTEETKISTMSHKKAVNYYADISSMKEITAKNNMTWKIIFFTESGTQLQLFGIQDTGFFSEINLIIIDNIFRCTSLKQFLRNFFSLTDWIKPLSGLSSYKYLSIVLIPP